MSPTRKIYVTRLAGRCLILALCAAMCVYWPGGFDVLNGMNFFKTLSPLHFL